VASRAERDLSDVSVLVVTYNGLPHVERCLQSVRDLETIVVDHGSLDGTVELVRAQFPDVTVVTQENLGFAAGVNAGARASRGRYLLLLNSDAWVLDDAVRTLVEFADAHPEAAAVGPRLRYPDGAPQVSMRGFPTVWRLATQYFFLSKLAPRSRVFNAFYGGDKPTDRVNEVDFIKGACLLVRRKAYDEIGPFDEKYFMFCEEADWSFRGANRGWKTVYVPHANVVHVGEATTKSMWSWDRTFREQERSHLLFLAKHQGARAAGRARVVIGLGYVLRTVLGSRAKRAAYRRTARWLLSNRLSPLLATGR
jgi:GT2 family glycosyltransferase